MLQFFFFLCDFLIHIFSIGSGGQRFVALIYKQNRKLYTDEPYITRSKLPYGLGSSGLPSPKTLGPPIAGNFFYVYYPKISETFVYPKNCDPKKFAEHCQVVLSIKQIKNGYLQFIAKLRKDEKWADLAFNANNEKPFWDTFRLKSNGDIIDGYIPHL